MNTYKCKYVQTDSPCPFFPSEFVKVNAARLWGIMSLDLTTTTTFLVPKKEERVIMTERNEMMYLTCFFFYECSSGGGRSNRIAISMLRVFRMLFLLRLKDWKCNESNLCWFNHIMSCLHITIKFSSSSTLSPWIRYDEEEDVM